MCTVVTFKLKTLGFFLLNIKYFNFFSLVNSQLADILDYIVRLLHTPAVKVVIIKQLLRVVMYNNVVTAYYSRTSIKRSPSGL